VAITVLVAARGNDAIAQPTPSSVEAVLADEAATEDGSNRFLLVPYPITEPAVGSGLLLAPAWMRAGPSGGAGPDKPQAFGFGALWTDGGSRGAFAFDARAWDGGTWRTTVIAANVDLQLKYPGLFPGTDRSIGFDLRVAGGFLQAERSLGEGSNSLGVNLFSGTTEADFGLSLPPELAAERPRMTVTGVTLKWSRDTRDDVFAPSTGQASSLGLTTYPELLGSTFDAQRLGLKWMGYYPVPGNGVLGVRTQVDLSFGNPPFYLRPYIDLRGIPALRYPGEQVALLEGEYRLPINRRWDVVAFGGLGAARADIEGVTKEKSVSTAGVGIRFKAQRLFGLTFGIDVARGPDGTFVYIQVGNPWSR
jgi:hypothetical protein